MIITPEVVMAASIGVLVVERGWCILKELRSGNEKNGHHCAEHGKLTNDVTEIKTDVKWIKKSLTERECVRRFDPRD